MKNFIFTLFLLCILSAGAFGQTMLDVKKYAEDFGFKCGVVYPDDDFIFRAPRVEHMGDISNLGGRERIIDIPLEIALFSYYATSRIDLRPAEADAILPKNNPKLADQKRGAAVFQEIQILRFLADTAAVNRHETVLKFITDRGNATRAEIETYYRNGIRGLVSAVVDEEFNKVSFLSRCSPNGSYNVVLIRIPQTGQYILNYEGYFNGSIQTKTLTASSLEALLSTMTQSTDWNQTSINTVRAQAALIPAVALSSTDIQAAKNELTNFLLTPNEDTLLALRRRYRNFALTQGERSGFASRSLRNVVSSFSEGLAIRMTAP
jgi:hypothetical protein